MKPDTYRGATFISTDAHVTEPIALYTERLDASLRPRAPRIDTRDDWRVLVVEGLSSRKLMSASQLQVAVVGDWELDKRVNDQERDGVSAEVVFPTFALQACFASDDPALQLALCRAYNGWATEMLGGHHRILPVGLVPSIDIDDAVREVKLVADAGFRALFLPARVPSRPYNDAAYDPLWAAGGALDRFPDLQVVTVETGASWLGWIMTQADRIYEDHSMFAQPKLSLKPSELLQRQAHATFMYDPVAVNNRAVTGVSTLMWGNDYPHPEGTWPASRAACEEQFAGVSDEDFTAIVNGNAAAVFGFDLAALTS